MIHGIVKHLHPSKRWLFISDKNKDDNQRLIFCPEVALENLPFETVCVGLEVEVILLEPCSNGPRAKQCWRTKK